MGSSGTTASCRRPPPRGRTSSSTTGPRAPHTPENCRPCIRTLRSARGGCGAEAPGPVPFMSLVHHTDTPEICRPCIRALRSARGGCGAEVPGPVHVARERDARVAARLLHRVRLGEQLRRGELTGTVIHVAHACLRAFSVCAVGRSGSYRTARTRNPAWKPSVLNVAHAVLGRTAQAESGLARTVIHGAHAQPSVLHAHAVLGRTAQAESGTTACDFGELDLAKVVARRLRTAAPEAYHLRAA